MQQQQLLERVRLLSPAHQEDVWNTVTGTPTLKHRFQKMNEAERPTKLMDFERYAGWTIPTVFPPENMSGAEDVQYDFQSLGAQLVENLTNKVMLGLFHPSRSFFKCEVPEGFNGLGKLEAEAFFSVAEKAALKKFAEVNGRVATTNLVQSLIVTGNGMLHTPKDKNYRWFSYRDYNARFDSYGVLTECILREREDISALEDDVAKIAIDMGKKKGEEVTIYTGIMRIKLGWYLVWQEIEDHTILAHRYGVYDADTLPFKPQRWKVAPGRQAGVGVVEYMSGDFHTLSSLAETDLDIVALLTDIKTLVNPTGLTKVSHLNNTPPGAYVPGRKDDIHSHHHDMGKQSSIIDSKTQQIARRLAQVFLMTTGVVRDAERVTAEEIRIVTGELQQQHVGAFSQLGTTLQYPIARDTMRRVDPELSKVSISIITGLESISRLSDLENVRGFLADMAGMANMPPLVQSWLNMENLASKFASGWGVVADKLVLTAKEKSEADAKALQMQAASNAAESIGQNAGVKQ